MRFLIIFVSLFFIGCGGADFPSIEESNKIIVNSRIKIDSLNQIVISNKKIFSADDVTLTADIKAFNKIILPLAYNRIEDMKIFFPPTRPLIKEDKSLLGISYTNYINIDTGTLNLDLKYLKIEKSEDNKIFATLELEGKGNITVSGKYMGVPAAVSPGVELYLKELVVFKLRMLDSGYIALTPEPKELKLKTKISLKLLAWDVPFYREIPLKSEELLKTLKFPLALSSDVLFPVPAQDFGDNKLQLIPYNINLNNPRLSVRDNKLEYSTGIDFIKK